MDHLPYPDNPVYPPLKVPYLIRDVYENVFDKIGFERYPEALGFDREKLDYKHYDAACLDPVLQEWVFFGLLSHIFGLRSIKIEPKIFARHDDSGTLSSIPLLNYFEQWHERGVTQENKAKEYHVFFSSISVAADAIAKLGLSITWTENLVCPSEQDVLYLSYVLLLEHLQCLVLADYVGMGDLTRVPGTDAHLSHLSRQKVRGLRTPLFNARLDASDWCPNHIQDVRYNASVAYWLSSAFSYHSEDHSQCSRWKCSHGQVDKSKYETNHVPECNGCESLRLHPESVADILRKDCIPVISARWFKKPENKFQVVLAAAQKDTNFVAISHVWSHGLGNPHANALPTCQLQRIALLSRYAQYAQEIPLSSIKVSGFNSIRSSIATSIFKTRDYLGSLGYQSINFWIDTLCVPIEDAVVSPSFEGHNTEWKKRGGLRKFTIRQMAEVYTKADRVLVLDAGLVGRLFNHSEKLMRVATCKWMRRLWTLQEACLAGPCLYFQFEDGPVSLWSLMLATPQSLNKYRISSWYEMVANEKIIDIISAGNVLRASHGSSIEQLDRRDMLGTLLDLLPIRSTSKLEDEAICLSTLLGIDVSQIYDIKEAPRRMGKFFEEVGEIHPRVLFASGPRLTEKGFRWAPVSFLSRPSGHYIFAQHSDKFYKDSFAIQRAQGLFIRLPYWLIIPPTDISAEKASEMKASCGKLLSREVWPVECYKAGKEDLCSFFEVTECTESTLLQHSKGLPEISLPQASELAILWLDHFDAFSDATWPYMGILVSIDRKLDGEEATLVHYLCRVKGLPREDWRSDTHTYKKSLESWKLRKGARTVPTQGTRLWCVD